MSPELDEVAELGDHAAAAGQLCLHVEGVWREVGLGSPREELLDLRWLEPWQPDVDVWGAHQFIEQDSEFVVVPGAGDLVEGDDEGLLLGERQVDDADLDLPRSLREEDLEALVAADEVPGAPVPDEWLDAPELVEAAPQALVLGIVRLRSLRGF